MNEERENIKAELQNFAPILAKVKKAEPNPPYLYFENLPDKVLQRIAQTGSKSRSFWEDLILLLQPQLAMPIVTVLMLAIASNLLHSNDKKAPSLASDFIVWQNKSFTIDYLIEEDLYLHLVENKSIEGEDWANEIQIAQISDESIYQYLNENIEDSYFIEQ